eukprot:Awhi_evm1s11920
MGIVFGKVDVESPAHEVIKVGQGYEIRKYPSAVAAEVMTNGDDNGFRILANYIGVFGDPQNK